MASAALPHPALLHAAGIANVAARKRRPVPALMPATSRPAIAAAPTSAGAADAAVGDGLVDELVDDDVGGGRGFAPGACTTTAAMFRNCTVRPPTRIPAGDAALTFPLTDAPPRVAALRAGVGQLVAETERLHFA
jgi:hypothetical protein